MSRGHRQSLAPLAADRPLGKRRWHGILFLRLFSRTKTPVRPPEAGRPGDLGARALVERGLQNDKNLGEQKSLCLRVMGTYRLRISRVYSGELRQAFCRAGRATQKPHRALALRPPAEELLQTPERSKG